MDAIRCLQAYSRLVVLNYMPVFIFSKRRCSPNIQVSKCLGNLITRRGKLYYGSKPSWVYYTEMQNIPQNLILNRYKISVSSPIVKMCLTVRTISFTTANISWLLTVVFFCCLKYNKYFTDLLGKDSLCFTACKQ